MDPPRDIAGCGRLTVCRSRLRSKSKRRRVTATCNREGTLLFIEEELVVGRFAPLCVHRPCCNHLLCFLCSNQLRRTSPGAPCTTLFMNLLVRDRLGHGVAELASKGVCRGKTIIFGDPASSKSSNDVGKARALDIAELLSGSRKRGVEFKGG